MPITIQQIAAAADPLRQFNVELVAGGIPGGGSGQVLRARSRSIVIPGSSTDDAESVFQGFTVMYPGRGQYSRKLAVEVEETSNLEMYNLLYNWKQLTWDPESGVQLASQQFKITAEVHLLRGDKSIAGKFKVFGMYPQEIGDVTAASDSSDAIRIPVTFNYDFHKLENGKLGRINISIGGFGGGINIG